MNPKHFAIQFHFQKAVTLRQRNNLKQFIAQKLLTAGKEEAEVNFVFCSDDELLEINRTHLNHDYFTDIITFDLSEKKVSRLLADIYISVDRVKENATGAGVDLSTELHRVMFHGLLHIIGYKDKTSAESRQMRNMEDLWLQEYKATVSRGTVASNR